VYIGNKGWVGITPSGRVGYKTANGSYTPIKNLTDYDKASYLNNIYSKRGGN
jgi:hypothetical protein